MGWIVIKTEEWQGLAGDAQYNARNLAKLCGISNRQLQRRFQREFGRTPQEWLDEQRIKAAGQLLLLGEPLKKVAFDLGYKQTSHFCRKFKSKFKLTPSQFIASKFQLVVQGR
jgi:AraC-like DNA-binding protein